jgi:hypothetical protein
MAGKRGIEAGRAYVRATMDDSLFRKGLNRIKTGLMGLGRALPAIASGIFIFKQIGAAVQTAANKVTEAIEDLAAIDKVRKAFGATAEQASGLFGVFKASGATNARENIESLVTLSGRIKDVLSGTGEESKKLFKGLSVSAEELSKLPIDEQFFRLHEAIMQLPDPMDRVNRLMLAFGEDGGKTLIGTLSMSTPQLREMAKQYGVSAEQMEDATKAQKAFAALSAASQRVWQKIAVTVAPFIVQAVDGLFKITHWVSEWVRQNRALQGSLQAIQTALSAAAGGQWAATWKVAVASVKAVLAEAAEWLQGVWIDATTGIASLFIDLSATIQAVWTRMVSAIVTKLAHGVGKTFEWLAKVAQKFGISDVASAASGVASGARGFGSTVGAGGGLAGADIERQRREAQRALREDAQRRRGGLGGASDRAAEELARALEEAKQATETATQKAEGIAAPGGLPGRVKADNAINQAAVVGSQEGAEAFLRAISGRKQDGTEAAVKEQTKATKEMVREFKKWDRIVITPGETR